MPHSQIYNILWFFLSFFLLIILFKTCMETWFIKFIYTITLLVTSCYINIYNKYLLQSEGLFAQWWQHISTLLEWKRAPSLQMYANSSHLFEISWISVSNSWLNCEFESLKWVIMMNWREIFNHFRACKM